MAQPQPWPGDSPADWIEDLGHAIAERYRRIEDALHANLRRHLEQALDAPDDLIARYRAIQELREQAERLTHTVDPATLARWATEEAATGASAEISRQLLNFPAYRARGVDQVTSLTAGGAYAVAAVELDLRDSLRALNARILRAPVDAYQAMTSEHVGSMLAGITTRTALHRRILDQYLADGITGFIDKSGRRWTIGAYSEMATRTAAARAWKDQSIASMQNAGIDTMMPVVANDACPKCGQWIGKIITSGGPTGTITVPHGLTGEPAQMTVDATIDDWRASGAGHPNCTCSFAAYVPGFPDQGEYSSYDPQKYEDRQKQRALEREVRQAKRENDPAAIGEAQAKLRDHTRETGLRRRYDREQLPFADGSTANPRGQRMPSPQHYSPATKTFAETLPLDLTEVEKQALTKWSGGYHRDIQPYLRGTKAASPLTLELLQSLDSSMVGHGLRQNMQLFRVEQGSGQAFGISDISTISQTRGSTFTWKGFTSTSWPGNAEVVAQSGDIAVTLRAPRGTRAVPIASISEYPTEGEILLDRDLRVRVVEATYNRETGIAEVIAEIIGG